MGNSNIAKLNAAALILLVGMGVVSFCIGVAHFDLTSLFTNPDDTFLFFISRLPRTLAAVLMGGTLAVAGVIMQLLVRNRFVGPGTTGTVESAVIGMLLMAWFFPMAPTLVKAAVAAVFSLGGLVIFLGITTRLPVNQPFLIPLIGIVFSGVVGAVGTFIALKIDLLQLVYTWINGDFSSVLQGRYELLWLAATVAVFSYFVADQFSILGLGRSKALSLGLGYNQVMLLGMLCVAIITATNVATIGTIPFVGLVIPNIVARLVGDNLRKTLPLVALLGANLVLLADIFARTVRFPYEIPAGTIFGVLGAIIFLWMVLGGTRRA